MEISQTTFAKFDLPVLPFSLDALEPHVSKATLKVHFDKHHRSYVSNLNQEIKESQLTVYTLEDLLQNASRYTDAIRNNGGGHYNHNLFWSILSPEATKPKNKLLHHIVATFKSLDSFKDQFKRTATSHFGSSWAWLVYSNQNELRICSTPNQDNPMMDVSDIRGYPLLGLDLWEHAYYLDYQNRKDEYIESFWQIIDWNEVSNRHKDARRIYKS